MRVLVTNDDGVTAPGLGALARAMVAAGHDVVVAAPLDDRSGSSAAVGPVHLGEGITLERPSLEGLDSIPVYGIEGPPGLAVMTARLGGIGPPPEVVVAGVNPGPNTGRAVVHSGTVGAALTAANFGVSAVAVSQAVGEPWHVATACALAVDAVHWLAGAPRRTVLNLNVPNAVLSDLAGIRAASLAPFGTVRAAIAEGPGGRLQVEFSATEERLDANSDTMLLLAGYATVTALVGIRAADTDGGAAEFLAGSLARATT